MPDLRFHFVLFVVTLSHSEARGWETLRHHVLSRSWDHAGKPPILFEHTSVHVPTIPGKGKRSDIPTRIEVIQSMTHSHDSTMSPQISVLISEYNKRVLANKSLSENVDEFELFMNLVMCELSDKDRGGGPKFPLSESFCQVIDDENEERIISTLDHLITGGAMMALRDDHDGLEDSLEYSSSEDAAKVVPDKNFQRFGGWINGDHSLSESEGEESFNFDDYDYDGMETLGDEDSSDSSEESIESRPQIVYRRPSLESTEPLSRARHLNKQRQDRFGGGSGGRHIASAGFRGGMLKKLVEDLDDVHPISPSDFVGDDVEKDEEEEEVEEEEGKPSYTMTRIDPLTNRHRKLPKPFEFPEWMRNEEMRIERLKGIEERLKSDPEYAKRLEKRRELIRNMVDRMGGRGGGGGGSPTSSDHTSHVEDIGASEGEEESVEVEGDDADGLEGELLTSYNDTDGPTDDVGGSEIAGVQTTSEQTMDGVTTDEDDVGGGGVVDDQLILWEKSLAEKNALYDRLNTERTRLNGKKSKKSEDELRLTRLNKMLLTLSGKKRELEKSISDEKSRRERQAVAAAAARSSGRVVRSSVASGRSGSGNPRLEPQVPRSSAPTGSGSNSRERGMQSGATVVGRRVGSSPLQRTSVTGQGAMRGKTTTLRGGGGGPRPRVSTAPVAAPPRPRPPPPSSQKEMKKKRVARVPKEIAEMDLAELIAAIQISEIRVQRLSSIWLFYNARKSICDGQISRATSTNVVEEAKGRDANRSKIEKMKEQIQTCELQIDDLEKAMKSTMDKRTLIEERQKLIRSQIGRLSLHNLKLRCSSSSEPGKKGCDETKVEISHVANAWNKIMKGNSLLPKDENNKFILEGLIRLINAGYNTLILMDHPDWARAICLIVAPGELASHYSHCGGGGITTQRHESTY